MGERKTIPSGSFQDIGHIFSIKREWPYLTIPTLVFLALEFQWGIWISPPKKWFIHITIYLLINIYSLSMASLSNKKLQFLVVFLPYAFLPSVWRVFSLVGINPYFSFFFCFVLSSYSEFVILESIEVWLDIGRIGALTALIWVMKKWWTSLLILL